MVEGRKRFKGVLAGIEGDNVAIDLEGEDETALIPFAWIVDAKLVLNDELMKRGADERAARLEPATRPTRRRRLTDQKRTTPMALTGISANRLELLQIADAVAREKSIDKEIVIEAIEEAIQKGARVALRRRARHPRQDRPEDRRDWP